MEVPGAGDAKEAEGLHYFDVVRNKLQQNWFLPIWLARQNFSAQVRVYIDARGYMRSFELTKASGNSQFDDAVKRTLVDSQPFSPPPEELVRSMLSDGITIGFPL